MVGGGGEHRSNPLGVPAPSSDCVSSYKTCGGCRKGSPHTIAHRNSRVPIRGLTPMVGGVESIAPTHRGHHQVTLQVTLKENAVHANKSEAQP